MKGPLSSSVDDLSRPPRLVSACRWRPASASGPEGHGRPSIRAGHAGPRWGAPVEARAATVEGRGPRPSGFDRDADPDAGSRTAAATHARADRGRGRQGGPCAGAGSDPPARPRRGRGPAPGRRNPGGGRASQNGGSGRLRTGGRGGAGPSGGGIRPSGHHATRPFEHPPSKLGEAATPRAALTLRTEKRSRPRDHLTESMPLVVTEPAIGIWAQLEGETPSEGQALEGLASQGERTSESGLEAVPGLRALVARRNDPLPLVRR
jgi:hypothetical protein